MTRTAPTQLIQRPAPFSHVFVATDFSPGANQAIERASRLPLAEGATITIAHVLPDRIPKKARDGAEKAARRQLEQAMKDLRKAAAAQGRRDLEVSSAVCQGRPWVELTRHARSVGADLIVLGRHGERPVRDMFIGSTAERVVRASDLPVLVVSRKASHDYRRPLVAVDLEDTCRSVVAAALQALGPEVASGTMVHAYNVPFEGFIAPAAGPRGKLELRKEHRKLAASRLAELRASCDAPGIHWQPVVVRGDPRTAILAETQRRRADLLVVGTYGRSGLAHALLGSVAEWLLQAARCDVLVTRPGRVSLERA